MTRKLGYDSSPLPGLNNDSNGQSPAYSHGKFHIGLHRFKSANHLKHHNEQCRPVHRVSFGAILGQRSFEAARNRVAPEVRRQQRLERRELTRAASLHHHATSSLLRRRATTLNRVKENDDGAGQTPEPSVAATAAGTYSYV